MSALAVSMKPADERLADARTTLVLDHHWFGALAHKLKPVETGCRTMATDGESLFYSPDFVATLSDAELVGVYAHEIMHCACQHPLRLGKRDKRLANVAMDYAINPLLTGDGFTLPAGALIDPRFYGMAWEEIYDILAAEKRDKGEDDGEGQPGAGDDDGEGFGGVRDAPDPTQSEAEWKVAVEQATMLAQRMGTLPGHIAAAIKAATKPPTDWRSHLRRFVQHAAADDYSWRMANRRYQTAGLYLPILHSERMGPMAVYLDTSGSTASWQSQFIAEVESIAEECRPECIWLVECDAAVHRAQRFECGEPIVTEGGLRGQGGTDFRPPFQWAEREEIQPACAIYLTDAEGTFPAEPPAYPVLWAVTPGGYGARPTFGEVITLDR